MQVVFDGAAGQDEGLRDLGPSPRREQLRPRVHLASTLGPIPGRAGDGHLRRSVQRQLRTDFVSETGDAQILDEDGVRAGAGDVRQRGFRDGKLAIEHQRVEGDEALHAPRAQEVEDARIEDEAHEFQCGGASGGP